MRYIQVYFRINSRYVFDKGFLTEEEKLAFKEESRKLFLSNGWTLLPKQISAASDSLAKGLQEIYLHPMNFSGIIAEDEIPGIEALLKQATTFQCYATDCYESYCDLSVEECQVLLESKRESIKETLLQHCRTKRKNLYLTGDFTTDVVRQFRVRTVHAKTRDIASAFIKDMVEQLIASGDLLTIKTKNGVGIRTATDKDKLAHLITSV